MNVNELIDFLNKLKNDDKGDYKVIDDGYLNEIKLDNIMIDDKSKEIIL